VSLFCPMCHWPFTKQILKREPVKTWEHRPEYFDEEGFHPTRTCPSPVDVSKEIVEVAHHCSCRHCRHEWTEIKTVEFDR